METFDADLVLMLPMQACRLYKKHFFVLKTENPEVLPLHERIKYVRLMSGLSAVELAEKVGVGNDVISRYENNHISKEGMDVKLLKMIAEVCGQDKYFCCDEYHIFKDNSSAYIIKYMERNKLTNFALADKLSVSATTVKQWKKGRCCPAYKLWDKFFRT